MARYAPLPRSPAGQSGFLLATTLWILAAISIAAAFFGERVQQALRLATQRQEVNEAQINLNDARSEMLFRLATTPMSMYGLGRPPGSIKLDDRTYQEAGTTLQLQDTSGLIDLNLAPDASLLRLLSALQVPEARHAPLLDALRDYIDDDDLKRLNGAEAAQYAALGLPGLPRNAPLITPAELHQVIGWASSAPLQGKGKLMDLTTTAGTPAINANTASPLVLVTLPSVNLEAAKAIAARREVEPITAAWLDRMLGTQLDGIIPVVSAFPAHSVRVTQTTPALPWGLRYNVELTPDGLQAPWKLTSFHRIEKEAPPAMALSSGSSSHAASPPSLPPRAPAPTPSPLLLSN